MHVQPVAPALVDRLTADELARWEHHADDLLRRVSWEAARGATVTDEMRRAIAGHAALLAAGFEPRTHPFRNVTAVVVHSSTILTRGPRPGPVRGVMTGAPRQLSGLSGHGRGPILLDWRTVKRQIAAPQRGSNVIIHEFAHKLDQLDGSADGMPPLPDRSARAAWTQTIGTNYRRLRRRGPDPLVRAYAATNPAEYFAVLSELFLLRPVELRHRFPRVYLRLSEFYAQDPAARL